MRIDVVIPILNQASSAQVAIDSLKKNQRDDNRYVIVDNGSKPIVGDWVKGLSWEDKILRNNKNVGLPEALNQARKVCDEADYIFYTHSDIEMFEPEWDVKVKNILENVPNVGVSGFFGALGIGTDDIYKSPYEMHQLVRRYTISGDRCRIDNKVHHQGLFSEEYKYCAVLDGFGLIVKNELEFETGFGAHHMYDNDICLQSLDAGMDNIVINMDIQHYGGRTDVGEDWASGFGKTKQQVHEEAHPPFYEKWRKLLPILINK